MKTIVVSAVNLNVGGTLTILNDCLKYLSEFNKHKRYRVVALVFDKKLCEFPNVEYIETKWPKKRWINRLWYEYVSMKRISKSLGPIDLWFSLHDTTPNVVAKNRVVYCHNPFPFYKWKIREMFFAPKIVLFSLFSKYIYQKGIHKNKFVVVQQQWIKDEFKKMFSINSEKLIIALPDKPHYNVSSELNDIKKENSERKEKSFIFASSANSHKNFECLLNATDILVNNGVNDFKVYVTLNGTENPYARWLKKKWSWIKQIQWVGFQNRSDLFALYERSTALVFPSKVETWGLPISEYSEFDKPMLLADLPYAKETAASAKKVAYFDPNNANQLANMMANIINGDTSFLKNQGGQKLEDPVVNNWNDLFLLLLK